MPRLTHVKLLRGQATQVSDEGQIKNLEIFRGGNIKYEILSPKQFDIICKSFLGRPGQVL